MNHPAFPAPESRSFSPWAARSDPRKILIIRLHAIGDVAVTLPACVGLRRSLPDSYIEYLTSYEAVRLVNSLGSFDRVSAMPGREGTAGWLAQSARRGMSARKEGFDVIIDLQRNWVTRAIRRLAAPKSWGEFDRYSPMPAAKRVLETIHRTGFSSTTASFSMDVRRDLHEQAKTLLSDHGHNPGMKLIILNPAGLWKTRNWHVGNYVALAELWSDLEPVQFLLLGTARIQEKADYISRNVRKHVINLVGKTSLDVAFAAIQRASLMITEDSGLMHMAWCSGIPTVALFGSSRHVWSAPPGPHSWSLHSGDLACGQCMEPVCRFGDVHCLERRTPEQVLKVALELSLRTQEKWESQ